MRRRRIRQTNARRRRGFVVLVADNPDQGFRGKLFGLIIISVILVVVVVAVVVGSIDFVPRQRIGLLYQRRFRDNVGTVQ